MKARMLRQEKEVIWTFGVDEALTTLKEFTGYAANQTVPHLKTAVSWLNKFGEAIKTTFNEEEIGKTTAALALLFGPGLIKSILGLLGIGGGRWKIFKISIEIWCPTCRFFRLLL